MSTFIQLFRENVAFFIILWYIITKATRKARRESMETVDMLIINATVITMDAGRSILKDGAVAIAGDRIAAVGDARVLSQTHRAKQVIDAADKIVFPGLVNTHTHLFQCLLKGVARDKPLGEWLAASIHRAVRAYTPQRVYLAAMTGCMDAIRSGVTTNFDYMYTHGQSGLDEAVLQALEDTGMRGVLCRGYSDTSGYPPQNACPNLDTEASFFTAVRRLAGQYAGHPRLSIAMAPGSVYSLRDENSYRAMRALADELKISISMHILEVETDDDFYMAKYGLRTVPFLEETGVLGPDFLAVHCVHTSAEDIALFKKYDVKISHNPAANMILGSGCAPVPTYLREGLTVGLGVDGAASNDSQDMLETLKLAALLHKVCGRDAAALSANQVLEMATIGGAKALGMQEEIGSLEAGKKADLFIYDPLRPKSTPVLDPVAALVYAGGQSSVDTVLVGGQILLQDGAFPHLDEKGILRQTQQAAEALAREIAL